MKATRYVGESACSDNAYLDVISGKSDGTVIDTLRPTGNVRMRAKLDGRPVQIPLLAGVRDFLDLTISIYILDEISPRKSAPDQWSRNFEIIFPVRNPAVFTCAAELIESTIRFLSGDEYRFVWPERSSIPGLGKHRVTIPKNFDCVCLFSGGIDSLVGALHLLNMGKRILLVGHQADGVAAAAQKVLFRKLSKMFPGRCSLLQVRVARATSSEIKFDLPPKREETHRVRSLLFLGIAAAAASVAKCPEIYIPENGLIALNAPLEVSRLGALSTRTAHPKFLTGVQHIFQALGIYDGHLKNPFVFLSKTDMLSNLNMDAKIKGMLLRSVSCARPSRYQNLKVRHCGYCVPCIYRRAAMMAAGLDRRRDYAFDVFRDLTLLTPKQQVDFRALFRFAKKLTSSKSLDLERIVLSHGFFRPTEAGQLADQLINDYRPWADMLVRWGSDYLQKVQKRSSPDTKRILGLPVRRQAHA